MTDIQRTDELLRAARLSLTDEEKQHFSVTLDDFLKLARNLDEISPDIDTHPTFERCEMREDRACASDAQASDILKLSEGVTEKYVAVPITVDQQ